MNLEPGLAVRQHNEFAAEPVHALRVIDGSIIRIAAVTD
jgi:hypothetical protein